MRPSCSRGSVARVAGLAALLCLFQGCGTKGGDSPATTQSPGEGGGDTAGSTSPAAPAGNGGSAGAGSTSPSPSNNTGIAGRPRELVNPDNATVVFLYYDLAGLPLPIDNWVEEDQQVKYGPGPQKAPRRAALKAELAAGAASVRDVGRIRLSTNANLSPFDPTYGEFTVRALSPSSYFEFGQFGQKVALRLTNGRVAQTWKVPADQAQAISDRVGYSGAVDLDVLLEITGVQPGPGGGSIETRVVEYELREARGGATLGRVSLDQ